MDEGQGNQPSDAALLTQVRAGDPTALAQLWTRHHDAVSRFARQTGADPHLAEETADEAFEAMVRAIRNGAGPDQNVRAYLMLAVRRLLARTARREARVIHLEETPEPTQEDSDPVLARLERDTAMAAYERLSERDREVLHYLELEGMTPAEAAPLLGTSPNAVSQANVRAKRSLRSTYLQVHAESAAGSAHAACLPFIASMGAYRAGRLPARETAKLEGHIAGCARCGRIAGFVQDEARGMRLLVWPLLFGPGLAGYLQVGASGKAAAGLAGGAAVGGAAATAGGGGAPAAGGAAGGSAAGGSGGPGGVGTLLRVGRPRPGIAVLVGAAGLAAVVVAAALVLGGPGRDERAAPATTTVPATTPTTPATSTTAPTPTTRVLSTVPTVPGVSPPPGPFPTSTTAAPPPGTSTTLPPPAAQLALQLGRLGAAVPGGSLTLTMAATNVGAAASPDSELLLDLPAGATLADGAAAGCAATGAGQVRCPLPALAPGGVSRRSAAVTLGAGDIASFRLSAGADAAPATLTVGTAEPALRPVFTTVLRGHTTITGASLVTCAPSEPGCAAALATPGDPAASTRALRPAWVDSDADPSTVASAGAPLTLTGAVRFAALVWGGELEPPSGTAGDAGRADTVLVTPPGRSPRSVVAQRLDRLGSRYQGYAEVTDLVADAGAGTWTVADVQAGLGPATYAGWALVVVTADPVAPAQAVVVLAGLADVYPGRPATAAAYVPAPRGAATLWALAYEAGRDADGMVRVGAAVAAVDPWAGDAGDASAAGGFGVALGRWRVDGAVRAAPALTAAVFDAAADRYLVGLVALVADTDAP